MHLAGDEGVEAGFGFAALENVKRLPHATVHGCLGMDGVIFTSYAHAVPLFRVHVSREVLLSPVDVDPEPVFGTQVHAEHMTAPRNRKSRTPRRASVGPQADAAATAVGNEVSDTKDIERAIAFGKEIEGVEGVLVIMGDRIGFGGNLDLVRLSQ